MGVKNFYSSTQLESDAVKYTTLRRMTLMVSWIVTDTRWPQKYLSDLSLVVNE
jgi:hypothetical protein